MIVFYPFGMMMPGRKYDAGNGYRYGFNGKELDKEIINYDYGFRIYDPRLGRFNSVDPLTSSYPQLTPYQFASNSPIEGIDLDGLEYVSSKEARIEIVNGLVKLRVENMTSVVKNLLNNYISDPKNNPSGSIGGPSLAVGGIDFNKALDPQLPSSDPDPSDADPTGIPNRIKVKGPVPIAKSTGKPDKRFGKHMRTTSPEGARGFAYLQIAAMALEYGVNGFIKYKSAIDADYISRHITAFKSAAADVLYALKNTTLIPPEFQTEQYLSDITNVVLSGDSYVGKYDETTGSKLKEIGLNIYNNYSVKRKTTTKVVTQTLGDGITVNRTEIVPGPKYDAKYVGENPPLDDNPKPNP